jgi:hypothetical protein
MHPTVTSRTPYLELPSTAPKAQLSEVMEILILELAGTRTVTGAKPMPQQLPGNFALTSSLPEVQSLMMKLGELPRGMKLEYSSPRRP